MEWAGAFPSRLALLNLGLPEVPQCHSHPGFPGAVERHRSHGRRCNPRTSAKANARTSATEFLATPDAGDIDPSRAPRLTRSWDLPRQDKRGRRVGADGLPSAQPDVPPVVGAMTFALDLVSPFPPPGCCEGAFVTAFGVSLRTFLSRCRRRTRGPSSLIPRLRLRASEQGVVFGVTGSPKDALEL